MQTTHRLGCCVRTHHYAQSIKIIADADFTNKNKFSLLHQIKAHRLYGVENDVSQIIARDYEPHFTAHFQSGVSTIEL